MRYAFFGSPHFAAIILEHLVSANMPPKMLICNPDRPIGRKHIVTPPETKSFVIDRGLTQIEVIQPENLNELLASGSKLKALSLDFAVVAAYSKIIPREIIALFPRGVIGVHPSLLPLFRGASPIQSVIMTGMEKTGVTLYVLDEKMDHGPIIAQHELSIMNHSYEALHDALAGLAGHLLIDTIPRFLRNEIIPQEQDHTQATFTKKFTGEDGYVDPKDFEAAIHGNEDCALRIDRMIRALTPEPGVWTLKETIGKRQETKKQVRIKLLEAQIENKKLILKKIQEEGKNPTNV